LCRWGFHFGNRPPHLIIVLLEAMSSDSLSNPYNIAKPLSNPVLAPSYSDKKKEGSGSIETVMNSMEFPFLDRTTPNSVISTTSNDLSNW
jgi:hypothetical protein